MKKALLYALTTLFLSVVTAAGAFSGECGFVENPDGSCCEQIGVVETEYGTQGFYRCTDLDGTIWFGYGADLRMAD